MVRRRQQNSSQKKPTTGFVRIISGLWRGRKLPVHDAEGLRPTTDRVKETLFNWLAQDVPQAKCLDLFAGSGGLGFESASRQAELVTMIELNPQAFQQLQKNVSSLNANNIHVVNTDALSFLQQPGTPSQLVEDLNEMIKEETEGMPFGSYKISHDGSFGTLKRLSGDKEVWVHTLWWSALNFFER